MNELVAYLNGRFLPAREAAISIVDAGFVMGGTVTEQLRTFGGRLFRSERHFQRLVHSLEICGIDAWLSIDDFGRIANELVDRNHPHLADGDDLGLAIFVTPGPYTALAGGDLPAAVDAGLSTSDLRPPTSGRPRPTVGLHTFPLAFHLWADAYSDGVSLVTTSIRQVPVECWPRELKCRSRMHYYLADREAAAKEPGARALLLDGEGRVAETSTANIVIYKSDTGLISPPRSTVLPGVSLEVVIELAAQLGIPFLERELHPVDVATADEAMLSSTPNCLLPVTRFNGQPVGQSNGRPVFSRLLAAWNNLVGLDIAEQAKRFSRRPPTKA
jgi:branched-subunit amino acid aminotransferase/4-amino-4-deoxychorismate lyase